ncbi:hypothetical protein [Wenxinia saemankumensis]|uniref:Uncharacterized protein n=1 Tax=Wenxinia saemankumensis TaxID=1447782 RepID=A0A1M6CLR9_9RHOB|nr:hypothetical protein [Wenxinia saemankumensis]SHI61791.1 hypothetical protein SAMN05444417_1249 [Wenxinia saemankumensis]
MIPASSLSRQKRRLLLAVGGTALIAALRLGPSALVVYAAILAYVGAVLVLRLLPARRRLIEVATLGSLATAPFPVATELWIALSALFATALWHLLYGSWGERARLRFTLVSVRRAVAPLPADAVWQRLVPGSSHPDDYWTGTLLDFDADPDDPLTLYARFTTPEGLFTEATFTFLAAAPPESAIFEIDSETVPDEEEVALALRLEEVDHFRTQIDSRMTRANLPLRLAASHWFDDALGDDWTGLAQTTARRRRWSVERIVGQPTEGVEAMPGAAAGPGEARPPQEARPGTLVAPVLAPSPTRQARESRVQPIRNDRMKGIPDPDDFEEPFDIMKLMEDVRAS